MTIKNKIAGGNGGLGNDDNSGELLPASNHTTSKKKLQKNAAALMWELAEFHLNRCMPCDENFNHHFRLFVYFLQLEDKLKDAINSTEH